jgi:hypothetical protein
VLGRNGDQRRRRLGRGVLALGALKFPSKNARQSVRALLCPSTALSRIRAVLSRRRALFAIGLVPPKISSRAEHPMPLWQRRPAATVDPSVFGQASLRRRAASRAAPKVAHVTNEMSETNLVFVFAQPHLAAVTVRDPEIGAKRAEEPLDHLFAARRLDDEDGAVVMVEHPQPPVPFADPEAGLVGLQGGS